MKRQQFYHSSPCYLSEIWTGLSQHQKWKIWNIAFSKMEGQGGFALHAFVMLGTHVHILFSTPLFEENFVMDSLHQALLKSFREMGVSVDGVLEEPLLSEKIESYRQLLNTYRYIYRNPIEAGLALKAEEYPYSSLFIQLGGKLPFSNIIDPVNLIQHPMRILNWLNGDAGGLYAHQSRGPFENSIEKYT